MPLPNDVKAYPSQYTELAYKCAESPTPITITLPNPAAARRLRFKFYRWRDLLTEGVLRDTAKAIHIHLEQHGEERETFKDKHTGKPAVDDEGELKTRPNLRNLRFIAVDHTDEAKAISNALGLED